MHCIQIPELTHPILFDFPSSYLISLDFLPLSLEFGRLSLDFGRLSLEFGLLSLDFGLYCASQAGFRSTSGGYRSSLVGALQNELLYFISNAGSLKQKSL